MKRNILFFIALLSLIQVSGQIITDRPDQTESASTVGNGNLQIEAGLEYSSEKGLLNIQTQHILYPTTLFRYGIGEKFEVRLGGSMMTQKTEALKNSGIGDPDVGFKYQILSSSDGNSIAEGTEIAILAFTSLPIGSDVFSSDRMDIFTKLAVAHELSDYLGLGWNIGYDILGTDNFGSNINRFNYSVALGIGLNEKLGSYIEFYGDMHDTDDMHLNADAGFTYLVKDYFQLDLSAGTALDQNMFYVAAGFSWLIEKK